MTGDQPRPRKADPRTALLWLLASLLAVTAVGVAVYKVWPMLYPQTGERAALNPACDLRASACNVRFASGGQVTLDIRPRGIPVAQPLKIDVQLQGIPTPLRVELDLSGLDMDMGYNRIALKSTDAQGRFAGAGMLPVCVRDQMSWEARVLIYLPDAIIAAPFRIETQRTAGP